MPTPELSSDWGSTLHARLLIESLALAGHELTVFCSRLPHKLTRNVKYISLPLPLGHPVLLDEGVTDESLTAFIAILLDAFVKEHAQRPFEIIHAHYATITGFSALCSSMISGVPLIVSSFGRDLHVGAAQDRRYDRMVRLVVPAADALIASNPAVAATLSGTFRADADRVVIIPMGIDDRLFSRNDVSDAARQNTARPRTRFTIVNIVSCFGEEKGIETVIKSLHKLKSMGLYPILKVIGGDDYIDRRRETALKSLASQLGLGDSVEFVGRQPHETIPDYLASADVLVDGRSVESFSSTLLEALFSRVPVVASDTTENRRILGDGRYGTLFRAGDEDCLAAVLRDVLSAPATSENFRKQYSEWTATQSVQYSADGMAKATSEVYRKVLSRHSFVSRIPQESK